MHPNYGIRNSAWKIVEIWNLYLYGTSQRAPAIRFYKRITFISDFKNIQRRFLAISAKFRRHMNYSFHWEFNVDFEWWIKSGVIPICIGKIEVNICLSMKHFAMAKMIILNFPKQITKDRIIIVCWNFHYACVHSCDWVMLPILMMTFYFHSVQWWLDECGTDS